MSVKNYLFILLICCVCFSSCSGSRTIEKSTGLQSILLNPETVVLKKAKVSFKDGSNAIFYDLVVLNKSYYVNDFVPSSGFEASHYVLRTFNLQDLSSVRYSNSRLGKIGLISGGLIVLGGAVLLLDSRILFPVNVLFAILSPPIGMGIGYSIGAQIYINWQDYPLNDNESVPLPVFNSPPSKTMFLRWNIPLHRLKPF